MISTENKQIAIKSVQLHETDSGSAATQVAVATERIKELTEHLKQHKKDFAARRGLLQQVGKRKRLLQYIAKNDAHAYVELIAKLGIRR